MKGRERPWIMKHRLIDLMHVLRSPVEFAAVSVRKEPDVNVSFLLRCAWAEVFHRLKSAKATR